MCFFCNRQEEFQDFYSEENDLVYCNNICAVMDVLDHEQSGDCLLTVQNLV